MTSRFFLTICKMSYTSYDAPEEYIAENITSNPILFSPKAEGESRLLFPN